MVLEQVILGAVTFTLSGGQDVGGSTLDWVVMGVIAVAFVFATWAMWPRSVDTPNRSRREPVVSVALGPADKAVYASGWSSSRDTGRRGMYVMPAVCCNLMEGILHCATKMPVGVRQELRPGHLLTLHTTVMGGRRDKTRAIGGHAEGMTDLVMVGSDYTVQAVLSGDTLHSRVRPAITLTMHIGADAVTVYGWYVRGVCVGVTHGEVVPPDGFVEAGIRHLMKI